MIALLPNRIEAGRLVAAELSHYAGHPRLVVLGLPRGGLPVAFEVASALRAPLDVLPVRKVGLPGQEELAIGAVASGGICVLDSELIETLGIPRTVIEQIVAQQQRELYRRERLYRGDRSALDLGHKTVILVDDGIATGWTMKAAVKAVRRHQPDRLVVAAPVMSAAAYDRMRIDADEVVCLATPEPFYSVGSWYKEFAQVPDEEVQRLLAQSAQKAGSESDQLLSPTQPVKVA